MLTKNLIPKENLNREESLHFLNQEGQITLIKERRASRTIINIFSKDDLTSHLDNGFRAYNLSDYVRDVCA